MGSGTGAGGIWPTALGGDPAAPGGTAVSRVSGARAAGFPRPPRILARPVPRDRLVAPGEERIPPGPRDQVDLLQPAPVAIVAGDFDVGRHDHPLLEAPVLAAGRQLHVV